MNHRQHIHCFAAVLAANLIIPITQASSTDNVTAYVNGNIYTADTQHKRVSSVIVKNDVFTYVGNNAQSKVRDNKAAKIIDLKGKTVVPGLYDSHIHPIGAGEKLLFECNFSQQASVDEILTKVSQCAKSIPEGSWITGGSWGAHLLNADIPLTIEMLDDASNGRPVVLTDFSHHNIWANSEALKLARVSAKEVAQYGDLVRYDTAGALTGIFLEQAGHPITTKVPSRSEADYKLAAKKAISELNKVGIIGVKDSYVFHSQYTAYKQLDDNAELTANVALSWGWPSDNKKTLKEKQTIFSNMVKPSSGHLYSNFAKITLDGIPPTKTAAMLTPYHPVEEGVSGSMNYSPQDLTATLAWLDKNGFTTQVHAVGDRAARTVLNAVEQVRKQQGNSGLRHEIAHACIVEPSDIPRFEKLNVVPNFSPIFWYPSPIQDGLEIILGKERSTRNCEIKTLIENGSLPTGGSDWPVSADVNPWQAMEAMVTRQDPNGLRPDQALWPEQKVSIEQALELYTVNGAKAQRIDDKSGSITVGKSADMLIINQDIFTVAPSAIGETRVEKTIFEGQIVHSMQ